MSVIARNIRRNAVPPVSQESGNTANTDEQVKVLSTDTQSDYLDNKLVEDSTTFPTTIKQILFNGGNRQIQLSSESYFGNVLWVDPQTGNDSTAQRGRLNRKYSTLASAVFAAQSGDTIINIGATLTLTTSIIITNKNLNFAFFGTTIDQANGSFFANESTIKISGFGLFTGAYPTARLFSVSRSTVIIDGHFEVDYSGSSTQLASIGSDGSFYADFHGAALNTHFGVTVTSGKATIKSVSTWALGSAANNFAINANGILHLVDIGSLSDGDFNNSGSMFLGNSNAAITLQRCQHIACARLLYNTALGGEAALTIIDSKVTGKQSTALAFDQTIIRSIASASFTLTINNSRIESSEGSVASIYGMLNVTSSYLQAGDRDGTAITYTQTRPDGGQLINSCVIGEFAFATDNTQNFTPGTFIVDSLRTNKSFPLDNQIIEGHILENANAYLIASQIAT